MNTPVKFETRVLKVEVKEKTIKHDAEREMPAHFETLKIGKLTLEFDGDRVDAGMLADFIGDVPIFIGLASTQMGLTGMNGGQG